ncbi:Protein argonaute 12 [Zea mays]|uniref:Protein argonaute 12 n=1 Tax=Zea mays TaxID=4577 RepID=A0A317YKW7_MAIZE|nr:Protein argonaute 12 [Zea mays]
MSTRGGGGGRRGGRGQQGGGRGGGSGRGGGRGRGQVAADLGGFREDTRGGPGRGHRGGSASSGAAQRGGGHAAQSQSPHPAAGPGPGPGRGGYSSAPRQVSSGPTPAEVEAMRRQVERKVVVDETQAQRCQGSSSSQAPAPRPAMQDKAPGPLAPAGRPLSIPAQSPAFFQAPAVRPAMQAKPPGQVAQAASSSSSFPMLATVQAPTPGQPATALHGKPPGQVAQAASSSSSSFPMLATAQAPRPGRPATALQGKPPGQVVPAAIPSSFPAPAPVQGSTPGRPAMQAKPPGQVAPAASSSERPLQMQGKAPDQMAPAGTLPPASSKAMVFPPRPGYGTVGRRCQVRANHVEVKLGDKDIYHYDVTIKPESTSRARNRWIIKELVNLYKQHLDGRRPVYDGRKSLFTAGPLPFQSKEFVLMLTNHERGRQGEKEYKVAIKDAARIDMYSLKMFLAGRNRDLPQNTIQALDIALREFPTSEYTPISKSFFSRKEFGDGQSLGNGVECWRGYYQSLRPTQMGLSLNIDVSATSFYKAQPVIDFVVEYLNLRDTSKRISDQDRIKLKKALKMVWVATNHMQDKCIHYRITGLTSTPLKDLTFDQEGTRVSVVHYFKQRYNYYLQYTHWPCLQAGRVDKQIYLPIEVCSIVQGQRYSSKLNENQVRNILQFTCERPADRQTRTFEVFKNYKSDGSTYAEEFGLTLMDQLTLVDARVLPAPRLKYHDSGREKVCNPSIGQWNMINKRMVDGGSIKNWACITFASRLNLNDVVMFCEALVGMCNNIGMQMCTRPCVEIRKAHQDKLEAEIRGIHSRSAQVLAQQGLTAKQLELLIIILPDMSGFYGRIKRVCETELGLITQCCAPKNVRKGGNQYLENLSLKINVKVGGRNTMLEDAFNRRIPLLTDCPTIVFGADVTHPSAGESSSPSIAAVVASMDWPQVTKYKCLVSSQGQRVEIINDLYTEVEDPQKGIVKGGMIRDLLMSFFKSTGQKPSRIIFYRDGVSEGQFSQVLLYEIDAIRKACASLQDNYLPRVTFVVVQKRHHTRLFPENHRSRDQTDRSGNILPGTVVDTKICHPSEFDFYLCSHSGIKGTSRPAHYHVLLDENGFSADALQTLTYNLCYTYARCTRSVSIVPPAYYAHLGAFRARYYIEDDSSDQGSLTVATQTDDQPVIVKQLPKIKEYVQQFMFYC